jgi:S1-C subfamily serine protease
MSVPSLRRRTAASVAALVLSFIWPAAPTLAADTPAAPTAARASLNVVVRDPMEFERQMWRLEGGAWVVQAPRGGAARRAGIDQDDVIAGIDDIAIPNTAALVAALSARQPGDKVLLRVIRRGHPVEMSATLGTAR